MPLCLPLLLGRRSNGLTGVIRSRPEILEMLYTPYLAANWDAQTRFARIIDHCKTVKEIGGVFCFPANEVVDVVRLTSIDPDYRITLDQARWLLRDGQMVISLWGGIDRLFSIGFCLSSAEGKRIAYIGGIQGRKEPRVLDRYRIFTKQAFGMRPRDFLVEIFKTVCRAVGVVEVRAVSDLNHHSVEAVTALRPVKLSYDEVWEERGGVYNGNGFYILPVAASRRAEEDIPAKKKALYHKRYEMMRHLERELTMVVPGLKCLGIAIDRFADFSIDLIPTWFTWSLGNLPHTSVDGSAPRRRGSLVEEDCTQRVVD